MQAFSIRVPASTANIGPGFDVFGLALDLYITVDVIFGSNKSIVMAHRGEGEGKVPLDETNLLLSSAIFLAKKVNKSLPSNMNITVNNSIPLGGGLGSSGAAIVAGVLLANHVLNLQLSRDALMAVCVEIEGHPDNVTPALLGGCVACCGKEKIDSSSDPIAARSIYLPIAFDSRIGSLAITPHTHLATAKSRAALPDKYSKKDVIFNLQRVAILASGFGSIDNKDKLNEALKDVVHQPYRAKLVPGLEQILALNNDPELKKNGLIGIVLSGSGPSVLCLTDGTEKCESLVARRVEGIFKTNGLSSTVRKLRVDTTGALLTVKSRL